MDREKSGERNWELSDDGRRITFFNESGGENGVNTKWFSWASDDVACEQDGNPLKGVDFSGYIECCLGIRDPSQPLQASPRVAVVLYMIGAIKKEDLDRAEEGEIANMVTDAEGKGKTIKVSCIDIPITIGGNTVTLRVEEY